MTTTRGPVVFVVPGTRGDHWNNCHHARVAPTAAPTAGASTNALNEADQTPPLVVVRTEANQFGGRRTAARSIGCNGGPESNIGAMHNFVYPPLTPRALPPFFHAPFFCVSDGTRDGVLVGHSNGMVVTKRQPHCRGLRRIHWFEESSSGDGVIVVRTFVQPNDTRRREARGMPILAGRRGHSAQLSLPQSDG